MKTYTWKCKPDNYKVSVTATMQAAGDIPYHCTVTPEDAALPAESFIIETTFEWIAAQLAVEAYNKKHQIK